MAHRWFFVQSQWYTPWYSQRSPKDLPSRFSRWTCSTHSNCVSIIAYQTSETCCDLLSLRSWLRCTFNILLFSEQVSFMRPMRCVIFEILSKTLWNTIKWFQDVRLRIFLNMALNFSVFGSNMKIMLPGLKTANINTYILNHPSPISHIQFHLNWICQSFSFS